MSAATASSIDTVIIHVRLLGEGVDVWRPVEARQLSESTFKIAAEPVPEDESWSFQPGDIVVAEHRSSSDASEALTAVALAVAFDEPSWIRKAG